MRELVYSGNTEIMNIFKRKNGILKGHFLLSSGLHSEFYLQSALVLQYPSIANLIAKQLKDKLKTGKIDVVLSPAIGGIIIGQELADVLNKNCRAIFTERDLSSKKMILRRGFEIKKGEKVIIIEDVITTGGTTIELIELAKNYQAVLKSLCCIVDRRKQKEKIQELDVVSLIQLDIDTYVLEECPLCKKNIPLVKPGSKPT